MGGKSGGTETRSGIEPKLLPFYVNAAERAFGGTPVGVRGNGQQYGFQPFVNNSAPSNRPHFGDDGTRSESYSPGFGSGGASQPSGNAGVNPAPSSSSSPGFVDQPLQFYPGQTYAPFDPLQVQAQNYTLDFAQNFQPSLSQQATAANAFALGPVLDPRSNPYLAQTAAAAINPIADNLMERILPSLDLGDIQAGQFGGSGGAIAKNQAIRDFFREAGNTSANIYSAGYGQGLDLFGKGLALAPTTAQTEVQQELLPAVLTDQIGAQRQAQTQQGISEDVARFDFNQQAPREALQFAMNILSGGGGIPNFSQSSTNPAQASPIRGAIQGGLGGAGLASSLWGAGALAPGSFAFPPAAGVVALGALAGLL